MSIKNRIFKTVVLVISSLLALACSLFSISGGQSPDPSAVETGIAIGILSTDIANQQLTLQAAQAQLTMQAGSGPPPQPAQPTQAIAPTQPPTQAIQPSPLPSPTDVPPPAELVLEVQTSVDTFYCYQSPYQLTIPVKVSDIDRGMAVYYHIQDKNSGVSSDGQVIDLHRRSSNTRDATIIGGGSSAQNLQFPPLMGESYFVYQIISDDGTYRSPVYSDITFFPCGQ
jgi:hypothetical protein